MNSQVFFNKDKATLTCMVQADDPSRIKELMDKSAPEGAEAFGIQLEQLGDACKNREVYRDIFSHANGRPLYVTNYRTEKNTEKTDEELAQGLLEAADCGADLCDMMGDYFDRQPDEMTYNETAVAKQRDLIDKLHKRGAKVLMSTHIKVFTPADEVLKIALSHQIRGADISKIVVGAENTEQQIENLKIINLLKEKLDIPFLFLSVGECGILRRIGGEFGCCMYLCVYEQDAFSTPQQPLLKKIKLIRDNMN